MMDGDRSNRALEQPFRKPTGDAPAPDVSIITTVLDGEDFLAEAIDSILAQDTSAAWELLIVDDGSTDRSGEIAERYAREHPLQIRVLRHAGGVNRGISASRNLGLAAASAPVFAMLDADDVWMPWKLSLQLDLLDRCPEAAMVYGNTERWFDFAQLLDPARGSTGANYTPPLVPAGFVDGLVQPPALLQWFLADESLTPCTCSVLIRTNAARRLGNFAEDFTGLYDDQVFYAKLALAEPVYVDSRVVARYRQHKQSCCARAAESGGNATGRTVFLSWLQSYRTQFA